MDQLISRITQLTSRMSEKLSSQTIIDHEEDESAFILTNDMILQESQEERSSDTVEKKVKMQEMRPQHQMVQMNESSEQSLNMVISPPFPSQHSLNSYSVISVSEIDFVISENFEFHDINKLGIAMVKYFESVSARDDGVGEELRPLLVCLAPSTSPYKTVTHVLKNYSIYKGY